MITKHSLIAKILTITVILAAFFFFTHITSAATLVVDTTVPDVGDGQCSLLEAIENANADSSLNADCSPGSGIDTIEFDIGATDDTQVISDADVSYEITSPIIFNGLTQGNASCGTNDDLSDRSLKIELQGITLSFENGSNGSSIQGLSILGGEDYSAIQLQNMDGFDLTCSNIGIDASGTSAPATRNSAINISNSNNVTIGSAGLELAATNLFAGGNSDSNREAIIVNNVNNFSVYGSWFGIGIGPDFNKFPGIAEFIDIYCPIECGPDFDDSTNVTIIGNDFTGGSTEDALRLESIRGLTIVGNNMVIGDSGINLEDSSDINIASNTISGASYGAISIEDSSDITILDNVLSNNPGSGILFILNDDVTIKGNYIGTDETGMISEGNGFTAGENIVNGGIILLGGANITIGGDEPADRNIISGNDSENFWGAIAVLPNILDSFEPSEDVVIQGNYIGVAADGVTPLPNNTDSYGMFIVGEDVLVGGTSPEEYNIIQGGNTGIAVVSLNAPTPSQNISILGNKIYNNGVAIDLGIDDDFDFILDTLVGPNPNDAGDTDEGPGYVDHITNNLNHLLNYPEFTSYETNTTTTDIKYILDVPAGDYRIEFFQNSVLTNYGEGETFLAYQDITHAGNGPETFTINLPVTTGDHIAATATERNQATTSTFGATSEFSASATIQEIVEEVRRRSSSSSPQSRAKAQQAFAEYYAEKNQEEAPTTPTSPETILNSGLCPADLIITNNMKVGDRNGNYSTYHNGTVTQVALLQTHINRILAQQYNQAAGPIDGIFGPLTKQGVERLQTALNNILRPTPLLAIDGIVGKFTKEAINNSCKTEE